MRSLFVPILLLSLPAAIPVSADVITGGTVGNHDPYTGPGSLYLGGPALSFAVHFYSNIGPEPKTNGSNTSFSYTYYPFLIESASSAILTYNGTTYDLLLPPNQLNVTLNAVGGIVNASCVVVEITTICTYSGVPFTLTGSATFISNGQTIFNASFSGQGFVSGQTRCCDPQTGAGEDVLYEFQTTPEPSSIVLATTGLLGFALAIRRRNLKRSFRLTSIESIRRQRH